MKTLIVAIAVLLSGCATNQFATCMTAAASAATPELVAIEKLRCETERARQEAQFHALQGWQNSQPKSCVVNGQATLCQ